MYKNKNNKVHQYKLEEPVNLHYFHLQVKVNNRNLNFHK